MRQKYRMFLRESVYWTQDNTSGKQESLGTKDRTEAPLADLLQEFVSANTVVYLLLVKGEFACYFHGVPERLGDTLFEEGVLLIVRKQLFDGFPQHRIPGGRSLKKSCACLG